MLQTFVRLFCSHPRAVSECGRSVVAVGARLNVGGNSSALLRTSEVFFYVLVGTVRGGAHGLKSCQHSPQCRWEERRGGVGGGGVTRLAGHVKG